MKRENNDTTYLTPHFTLEELTRTNASTLSVRQACYTWKRMYALSSKELKSG